MSRVSCIMEHAIDKIGDVSFVDNHSINGKSTVYLEDVVRILIEAKNNLEETFEHV